ncbi:hypothetical protein ON010_g9889 [Phytophthora cinnamomi]|nr:hypothetical protein ON010_g9889 [Phytophthora cinnamomi]
MLRGEYWDADSVGGRPSSINVLLQWLVTPGNVVRWLQADGKRDGSRRELSTEIHKAFVSHGITHRTRLGIETKVWELVRQVEVAEKWLKDRRLSRYDVDEKTTRAVLQMCPYFRELSPSFRSTRFEAITPPSNREAEIETSSDESYQNSEEGIGAARGISHRILAEDRHRRQTLEDYTRTKWGSDGVDGRPSSLDVLLKWVSTPGNAARWQEAVKRADGSRLVLVTEIYDSLLTHGITHRTLRATDSKLYSLERHFDEAENWLKERGLCQFKETKEAERMVMQICPVYAKIELLLRSARRAALFVRTRTSSNTVIDIRFKKTASKAAELPGTKRTRVEGPRDSLQRANAVGRPVVLKAEPGERREFFKLELQVKRDQAICVRAKIRKEMLEVGVSREDVDRLLPL